MQTVTLDKEDWLDVAERLTRLTQIVSAYFIKNDFEGKGEQDAREFQADMACAIAAVQHVALFSSDKVIFAAPGDD